MAVSEVRRIRKFSSIARSVSKVVDIVINPDEASFWSVSSSSMSWSKVVRLLLAQVAMGVMMLMPAFSCLQL